MHARIARIVTDTQAEGPGRRFAIWFQGCPMRCPGCCNPEYLSFEGGESIAVTAIVEQLKEAAASGVEGVSFLGGEPFAYVEAMWKISNAARELNASVMIYSGYTLAELRAKNDPLIDEVLSLTDLLVDGQYERELPEPTRRWIGSTNQQIHFLSDRYSPSDPCWTKPNTLEIRVRGKEVTINGFPASDAKSLWKGWKRGK